MGTARAIPARTLQPRAVVSPAAPQATTERLALRAVGESLEPGRSLVRRALRRQGWEAESVDRVVLAVSEALTNAVEHGSSPGAPVLIEVAATAGRARVRVVDSGRPGSHPPAALRAPPPASSEHGRGLIIMGALADRLEIRPSGRGTDLRLAFSA